SPLRLAASLILTEKNRSFTTARTLFGSCLGIVLYFDEFPRSQNWEDGTNEFYHECMDVHSFSRPELARVRHLDLELLVDFSRKILKGSADVHFERLSGDELVLDTRGLEISAVENAESWELGAADPILGAPLRIRVGPGITVVKVRYTTSPVAS